MKNIDCLGYYWDMNALVVSGLMLAVEITAQMGARCSTSKQYVGKQYSSWAEPHYIKHFNYIIKHYCSLFTNWTCRKTDWKDGKKSESSWIFIVLELVLHLIELSAACKTQRRFGERMPRNMHNFTRNINGATIHHYIFRPVFHL